MRTQGFSSWETAWLGSDLDAAFAQFVAVPVHEVFTVACDWSDAELATVPCAYGTAENMVARAGLTAGVRVGPDDGRPQPPSLIRLGIRSARRSL